MQPTYLTIYCKVLLTKTTLQISFFFIYSPLLSCFISKIVQLCELPPSFFATAIIHSFPSQSNNNNNDVLANKVSPHYCKQRWKQVACNDNQTGKKGSTKSVVIFFFLKQQGNLSKFFFIIFHNKDYTSITSYKDVARGPQETTRLVRGGPLVTIILSNRNISTHNNGGYKTHYR